MKTNKYAQVRSKNKSCNSLRKNEEGIGPFTRRSIIRLGSTTETEIAFPRSFGKHPIIEVNTVEAIQNSRNKLLMKQCFADNKVKQVDWFTIESSDRFIYYKNGEINIGSSDDNEDPLLYPILAKRIFGFKGKGMSKINNQKELKNWLNNHPNLEGWYFEQYFSGSREYRLHVAEDGCFMAWRKLRKKDTPEDKRWYFNSDYCNWVGEDHGMFNKPTNWDKMVEESVKALKAVGLDIGSVDLRCQSSKKDTPEFKVIEINSAPSLGERGIEIYREKIYDIIQDKIRNYE